MVDMELRGGDNLRTCVSTVTSRAPLLVQKAIYPEAERPRFAHVYIMSSSGGILQGDEQEIRVTMGRGASARVTNQSATKIYKMEEGYAAQRTTIRCGEGSYLEFLPHQIIPFRSSRFYQEVRLEVEEDATAVYSEIISAGRIASGEKFDFDLCLLRTSGHRGGKVMFLDTMKMDRKNFPDLESVFGAKTVFSTIYVVGGKGAQEEISELIRSEKGPSLLAGCSELPNNFGTIIRILSDSVPDVVALSESVARAVRSASKV